jgi:bile acid-coenzyme A ligase
MSSEGRESAAPAAARVSYGRRLEALAERDPDEILLVLEDRQVTRRELDRRANRMARAFSKRGVGEGDTVTICAPNDLPFFVSCLAAWKLGAVPNPVPASLPPAERRAIIEEARPSLLFGVAEEIARIPSLPLDFEPSAELDAGPLPDRISPHERALASGGSTGRPKLIVAARSACYDPASPAPYFVAERAALVTGPTYHAMPFSAAWYSLLGGQRAIVMRRFDPERCLALIERHRIDRVYVVPTMMHRIWRLPEDVRRRYDLSSLRALLTGGAPCPQWLMRAWIEWLGPERIFEGYAPSERIGRTFITGSEWLAHPGSVGLPQDGCRIRILDDEGEERPPGEVGGIYMRPAQGIGSTFHYRGADRQLSRDGWETVGDVGYLDEDGYLYICDRRVDMILSGGRNVFAAEVEAAIELHPAVESSAVIGLPDEDLGQRLHAIVYAPEGVSEASLVAHMTQQLVGYKRPRSYEFVDASLRDDSGKMRRSALRAARGKEKKSWEM